MTTPKRWTPGDPLTADRLNQVVSESVRPRRDISLGNGSSLVNESLGNQSATARHQPMKLVVAVTDFAISETPTDIAAHADDVPSGFVKEVRLNRRSGIHIKDDNEKPFRAYDTVNGLSGNICAVGSNSDSGSSSGSTSTSESGSGTSGKSACDVFYVMFNLDSKRWEVVDAGGGSQTPRIRFTIVSTNFSVGLGALGCDLVVGLVNHVSCGYTGVRVGDEVNIYDPEYCHFNLPMELLVGLNGTATMMDSDYYQEGLESVLPCVRELVDAGCMWMIDTLCCSEEEMIGD
jgi:hypothetical protein